LNFGEGRRWLIVENWGRRFGRLLAAAKKIERRDWLLAAVIIMQAMTLYYAINAADQAENAWYAASSAQERSRSCDQALDEAERAASYAGDAARACRSR
jgi:hypothetical protein